MYVADREYGFTRIINEKGYKIGIEIGVRHGTYSAWLLEHTKLEKLYSLDCFEHTDGLAITYNNLLRFSNRSEIVQGFSPQASAIFPDEYFDFIYIDANHTYQSVKQDLIAWWVKLKKGGLFCGDDYTHLINPGQGKYGVVEAVNEFIKENNLILYVTGTEHHSPGEHDRIATGYGKIIEAQLNGIIPIIMGNIVGDDLRIPQWFTFKE